MVGLVWCLVFGVWLGLVVAAAWIGLALVWLVDIRDHGMPTAPVVVN